jgi:hypothetical protein
MPDRHGVVFRSWGTQHFRKHEAIAMRCLARTAFGAVGGHYDVRDPLDVMQIDHARVDVIVVRARLRSKDFCRWSPAEQSPGPQAMTFCSGSRLRDPIYC